MFGAQDMGGMHGFGPVQPEPEDGPKFKANWEKRAMALTIATGAMGAWTLDMARYARESLRPAEYLTVGYYGTWLRGVERLLESCGLASPAEIESGQPAGPPAAVPRVLKAAEVPAVLARGAPSARAVEAPPAFALGDRVRTRRMSPGGHCRLPRYVQGAVGTVVLHHGGHVLPDASAEGRHDVAEHLYTVRFDGQDLWGEGGEPGLSVSVDAWEGYLERA
jgi:nitrile hydratase